MQVQAEDHSLEETGIVAGWFGLGMFTLFAFGLWDVFLRLVGQPFIPAGVQLPTQIAAGGLFGLLVGIYGVRVRTTSDYVHVDVADDGPGIPSDERQRVLEPSVRGLDSEGEGLGLFLTRSIVEQYGGHIDIADNEPTGAVVTLSVPRADADPDKIPAQ